MNQLAALALLAGGAAGQGAGRHKAWRRVTEQMTDSLEPLGSSHDEIAPAFTYVERMFVIGRGSSSQPHARSR